MKMMVDFIFEIAHTKRFDSMHFSDVKDHAENILNVIEKDYVLANKKLDG